MAEIVLDHVSKRFPDGTTAVHDVNLNVDDGEFMILVGPSGSGKSTVLNMIAGLEDISEGELRIGGRVVNQLAPKDRDIAMVFQSYALYPHMTVRENMAFALNLAHAERAEIDRKVDLAADLLELSELLALAGPAGRVEAGDHLVAAAGGVAGAGVGGQLLQLLGGGAAALEAEVGVLVGPQGLEHVHGRLEGEALAPVAVHQGGVLEVLGPDADDQLAAGPGLPDLGAHLAR